MEFFTTIRVIVGFVLFLSLGINMAYQAFKAFRKIQAVNHSKDTLHTFKCGNCEETYQLNGEEVKERISIWSTKKEIKTPTSQTSAIRFECAKCQEKAFHKRIFDTDVTGLAGNVRAQFDDSTKGVIVELLIKGFLPLLIVPPFLQIIFP